MIELEIVSEEPTGLIEFPPDEYLESYYRPDRVFLVWSCSLALKTFIQVSRGILGDPQGDSEAMLITEDESASVGLTAKEATEKALTNEDRIFFYRVNYPDIGLTHGDQDGPDFPFYEASMQSARIDLSLVKRMIAATATQSVAALTESEIDQLIETHE